MKAKVKVAWDKNDRFLIAVERAKVGNMRAAGFVIQQTAKNSITHKRNRDAASPAGLAPHQHKAGFLKRAVRYDYEKQSETTVVGFIASAVGPIMRTHEHGGYEEGRRYPKRPVMVPALQRNLRTFPAQWRNSIH